MKEKEKTFKEEALGVLDFKIKKATNDFTPDKEKLRAPLSEGAGLRAFCCGCGSYYELGADDLNDCAAAFRIKFSPEEHYYETYRCMYCDSIIEKGAFKYIDDGSVFKKLK